MTPARVVVSSLVAVTVALVGACASQPKPASATVEAPSRSVALSGYLEQHAATRGFTLGRPASTTLTPTGDKVYFLRSGPRSFVRDLYEFDTATGQERLLLTADQILAGKEEVLTVEELARRERTRSTARGIASFELSKDGEKMLVPLSGRIFVIDRASGQRREFTSKAGFPIDPRFSPDGAMIAAVREGDLYVTDLNTGAERRLTTKDSETVTNGLAEFAAQEEMGRTAGYWWSPDATRIAYQRNDTEGMMQFYIPDPANPGKAPNSFPYPRAGTKNADVRLGVMSASGGETVWVDWDREQYPYLATVKWPENGPLTILVQNREQTEEVLLAVNEATGSTSTLLVERDDAWINLDQDMPRWFEDGSGFLWTSERSGWWRLERRARDGSLVRELTPAGFPLRGVVSVDEDRGVIWLSAGEDPTQTHLYRMPLAGGEPTRVTSEPGVHGASFSKDGSVYLHTFSSMNDLGSTTVTRFDGTPLGVLASAAETPPFDVNAELVRIGASPQFNAMIIRPRNFEPDRRYPVLVSVYGGPHAQVVTSAARGRTLNQWFADHGFIVVAIDGRGTPSRGRDWERAIKHDLIGPALADQKAALRALGERYPEMDLSRVGIYGWSFGGYFSAMAVMREPETFHVGVAGAPVCDWIDYDTHYTERYLGVPDDHPDAYERSNVLTYAKDLRRPLLVIHGTADDNVYLVHSLKMTDALFRAGVPYDFLPLAGQTHMVAAPEVYAPLQQRTIDYFVEHLNP